MEKNNENKDKKKSFLLRLSPEMLQRLEQWAQDEFRSTNGQIEYLLQQALNQAGRLKKAPDKEEGTEDKP